MDMDINVLRIAVTLLSFLIFAGIVRWALLARNKPAFDEAQQLPFLEMGAPETSGARPPEGARTAADKRRVAK